jgi:hypothetical protein
LPQLRWLGPDYVSVLVHDLTLGLLRQDAGTRVMGIRCEGEPALQPSIDPAGMLRGQEVVFVLQVFVQDGTGRPWRLNGRWTYAGRDLGTATASIVHHWELLSADGV